MPSSSQNAAFGLRAEHQVGEWLQASGWDLLHHRWHCRWGELDWVAIAPAIPPEPKTLVFVEVKARSRGNWDADGLLALTPRKQAKLWQAAELFLTTFPELATLPCRFDLVLVGKVGDRPYIAHHLPHAFERAIE